jgi:hypothetical protein
VAAEIRHLNASAQNTGGGGIEFLATDGIERFKRVGAYFFGQAIERAELVVL